MSDSELTVPRLLQRAVDINPDGDSFVFPDSRQTYSELEQSSVEIARSLVALGIGPGDAVGALMPNCPEFLHALFGTAMVGALFVPINSRLAPRELGHVIPDSGMKLILTTDTIDEHVDYVARLHDALPGFSESDAAGHLSVATAPSLLHAVVLGSRVARGFMSQSEFLDLGSRVEEATVRNMALQVSPSAPYVMMYTSGTTSMPKGCPLSHESVVRLGVEVGREVFHTTSADRMWNPLPMFHVSAQAPMIGMLDAAGTYVSMTHFEVTAALDLIEREQATLVYPAYPTITAPLLNHERYGPETFAHVRGMLTVGPPDLLASYQDKLPYTRHVSCYGSTETGGIPVMGRLDDPLDERLTCGKPFAGIEVEVRDIGTADVVGTGETGELHMRGYNLFLGYHNDPQKTADSFDKDGWFATGDLASVDMHGNLTYRGRTKDMLKVGGENVGCLEVEGYLMTHPDVIMAAVVGVPDAKYGEVPAAFVELRLGSSVTQADLLDYSAAGLAKYKVPRRIEMTTEWPMSATKIQKFRLRDRLLTVPEVDSGERDGQ